MKVDGIMMDNVSLFNRIFDDLRSVRAACVPRAPCPLAVQCHLLGLGVH